MTCNVTKIRLQDNHNRILSDKNISAVHARYTRDMSGGISYILLNLSDELTLRYRRVPTGGGGFF